MRKITLTLKKRIFLSFFIFLLVFLVSTLFNYVYLASLAEKNREMDEIHIPILITITESNQNMYQIHNKIQEVSRTTMGVTLNNLQQEIDTTKQVLTENLTAIDSYIESEQGEALPVLYDDYIKAWEQYQEVSSRVIAAAKEKNLAVSQDEFYKSIAFFESARNSMDDMQDRMKDDIAAKTKSSVLNAEQAIKASLILGILAIFLAIILSFVTERYIRKPIMTLSEYVEKIADGNLKLEAMKVRTKDELGRLTAGVNHMKKSIQSIFLEVKTHNNKTVQTTDHLSQEMQETMRGVENVVDAINHIASQSQSQLKELEQSSTFLKEIGLDVEEVNTFAEEMKKLGGDAKDRASQGLANMDEIKEKTNEMEKSMYDSVTQMEKLDKQMKQIDKVLQSIQQAASQTNLLALNAQVEAARAGEAGQGFSVVANEIRQFADQSKISSEEIRRVIEDIKEQKNTVINHMNQTKEHAVETNQYITHSHEHFQFMDQLTDKVSENNALIVASMEKIKDKVINIRSFFDSMKETASHHVINAKEVAETSGEMNKSVEKVNQGLVTVKDSSGNLHQHINQYQI